MEGIGSNVLIFSLWKIPFPSRYNKYRAMRVYAGLTSETHSTGGYDPEDSWSRDSTHTDWTFTGLFTCDPNNYYGSEAFEVDAEVGDVLHCVCVIYSTGDSFGTDTGDRCNVIGVYKTLEEAWAVKKLIEADAHTRFEYGESGNHVTLPDGAKLYTGSWKGYFESLDRVTVDSAEVQ